MGFNNKNVFFAALLIFVISISGCELLMLTDWNDTRSLEEHGNGVRLTMATLVTYIDKNKDDVKKDFGEPTEVKHESGMIATHYQLEKVSFDELWYYIYRRGVPGINAEGSTKRFFFNKDKVVSVDAL